jgi:Ca2+-binding RTX toxin-like protein
MDAGDFFDGETGQDGIDFFGTSGNDHILVKRQVGPNGAQALIEMNNKSQVFNYVNGETINVYAGAGNDHVTMDPSAGTHWIAQFFGQEGNDQLTGGAMNDLLDGGQGNDNLDGGGGDNVLIGGGGHDVLRNGHAPLTARALAAATAAPVADGTSTKSSSARLDQVAAQLDNRSGLLELGRIDAYRASLARFYQELADKKATPSRITLLDRNNRTNGLDDELLDALMSSSLSKENGSTIGAIENAFAARFSAT